MIPINNDGHRIDILLPVPTQEDWAEYANFVKVQRPCNDYQLHGTCEEGSECIYSHKTMDARGLDALRYMLRGNACVERGACRKDGCYMGHICQRNGCKGKKCSLKDYFHSLDPNVAGWAKPGSKESSNKATHEVRNGLWKSVRREGSSLSNPGEELLIPLD